MDQRSTFASTASELLDAHPELAIVLADISVELFADAALRHPDRVINVGIREQLQVGVAGGLALTGRRPVIHTYAPFLVERAYEQIKLDLDHQQVGAILVGIGGSYDTAPQGRTHFSPADVALFDTLGEWTVRTPGHPAEVKRAIQEAVHADGRIYVRLEKRSNADPHEDYDVIRTGGSATVFAVGTSLDTVTEATRDLDVTLIYLNAPRPLDQVRLRSLTKTPEVVVVEPYLKGTSSAVFTEALRDAPRRFTFLGVGGRDLHLFGTPEDHDRAHGLDVAGIRRSIEAILPAR